MTEKHALLSVLTLLLLSAVYTIVMTALAPAKRDLDEGFTKVKSDYILMSVQCPAAADVLLRPSLLQHKFRIELPNPMSVVLALFGFAAVYLGEVQSFYYRFAFRDKLLHTFSGIILGAAGFSVIQFFTTRKKSVCGLPSLPYSHSASPLHPEPYGRFMNSCGTAHSTSTCKSTQPKQASF